jgi:hypothetical protein
VNQAHNILQVLAGGVPHIPSNGPHLSFRDTVISASISVAITLLILVFFLFYLFEFGKRRLPGEREQVAKRMRELRESEARQKKEVRVREEWMDQLQRRPGLEKLKPRDLNRLVSDLSSEHPHVRRQAAKLLRQKGGPGGIRQACDQFALGRHPDRVSDAILAAQWSEMEPPLLRLIDRQDTIGSVAIKTLAELGGAASLTALLAQAATPTLKQARDAAILRLRERLRDRLGGRDAEGRVSLASDSDQIGALGFPPEYPGKGKQ